MSKPKKLVLFFAAVMLLASLSNIAGRHDAETVITSGAVALLAAFTAALIIYRHMWRKPPTEPPTPPARFPLWAWFLPDGVRDGLMVRFTDKACERIKDDKAMLRFAPMMTGSELFNAA